MNIFKDFSKDTLHELFRGFHSKPLSAYEIPDNVQPAPVLRFAKLFNQRTREGAEDYVRAAIQTVADKPYIVSEPKRRKQILKLDPRATAASLCNSICYYLYFYLSGGQAPGWPSFSVCYLQAVNSNSYRFSRLPKPTLSYVRDYEPLTRAFSAETNSVQNEVYLPGERNYRPIKYNFENIIGTLDAAGERFAIVRNHANTHSYMIFLDIETNRWRCLDTWHSKWNGETFKKRCTLRSGKIQSPYSVYFFKNANRFRESVNGRP